MKNAVYIAASLDGYIAAKDGNIDWLMDVPNPDDSDFGFSEFMHGIDAVVMGRNTFEAVLGFGQWIYSKPVYVLSNSLQNIPEQYKDKAHLINGTPREILEDLNSRGLNNLYIDGGKTIHEFLRLDLIDELIITRIPVLLGAGIPLFADLPEMQKYEHVKTEVLNNTMVKSYYSRIRR